MKRVIIAGSRTIPYRLAYRDVLAILKKYKPEELELISGGCPTGPDAIVPRLARELGTASKTFMADWAKFGRSAGPRRNRQMAEYATELILIWDGKSRGSANMKEEALKRKLAVREIIYTKE